MRLDISVKGLFATPVAAVELPGAATRNAALRERILARRAETGSVQASNAGGWHSDREIASWGGPEIAEILDTARGLATRLTADRHGAAVRPAWTMQAWANVNGPGDPFELDRVALETEFGEGELLAYAEVLQGILDGDPTLSVRGDTAEQCWRIVQPVIDAWQENRVPLEEYPAGTPGPASWPQL